MTPATRALLTQAATHDSTSDDRKKAADAVHADLALDFAAFASNNLRVATDALRDSADSLTDPDQATLLRDIATYFEAITPTVAASRDLPALLAYTIDGATTSAQAPAAAAVTLTAARDALLASASVQPRRALPILERLIARAEAAPDDPDAWLPIVVVPVSAEIALLHALTTSVKDQRALEMLTGYAFRRAVEAGA